MSEVTVDLAEGSISVADKNTTLEMNNEGMEVVSNNWDSTIFNFNKLRIATQIQELLIQGVTIKNTFKEMNEVWLSLYTADKRCPIIDQTATKVKYQLVNQYAYSLIKYLNSIIGLDLVPLAQQDPTTRTWKMDSVILNVGGNKVNNHEHLFRTLMVNLFGVSENILDIAFNPTAENIRTYVKKTYDIDLGDTEGVTEEITIEKAGTAVLQYLQKPEQPYRLY